MRNRHANDRRFLHAFAAAAALFAALAGAAAPPAEGSCSGAVALTVDDTRRSSGSELLSVTLSAAGVLTLDVSSPANAVQPRIDFLGTTSTCSAAAGEGTNWDYVQETPKWLAARIDTTSSTTYYLRVVPQDSKETLGDFNLRVAWIADAGSPDETTDLSPDATDTCNSSADAVSSGDFDDDYFVVVEDAAGQWDPDIMQIAITVPGIVLVEHDDTGGPDLEATLFSNTSCAGVSLGDAVFEGAAGRILASVHEADHALDLEAHDSSSGAFEVAVRFYAPCDRGETDDHGSAARCATPVDLEHEPSGVIANDDDDDEDWFTLVLPSQITVGFETSGSTDTRGSLYDAAGQRLEVQDGGGESDNFRIARTLGPGRYYLRIEGTGGDEGSYSLAVAED